MNNINENRTDKRTPGGEKSKAELKWFVLFLAVIFFLPITILAVVELFTSADAFAIGITGFMQSVIVYGGLGLVAVIIALVLFILLIQPGHNVPAKGWQNRRHFCFASSSLSSLSRPLVLDIPYLKRPEAAYLERLEFEYSRGIGDYGSDDYYLRGVDMTGERHSFEISEKRYEGRGRALWGGNDYNLFAKVTYLPHTSTLIVARIYDQNSTRQGQNCTHHPLNSRMIGKVFQSRSMTRFNTLPVSPLRLSLTMGGVISEEDAGVSLS